MKIVFAIILLFTITVSPIQQISHVLYYSLNIDSITEKFCVNKTKPELRCHGKCQLVKKLNQTKTNQDKSIIVSSDLFFPLFFQRQPNPFNNLNTTYLFLNKKQFGNKTQITPYDIVFTIDHPPQS